MTQHILSDIVNDSLLFDPKHCVDEDDDEFRGLTRCQAGRALQSCWLQNLPSIRSVVKYLAESPEPLPKGVAVEVRKLLDFLEVEFRMRIVSAGTSSAKTFTQDRD